MYTGKLIKSWKREFETAHCDFCAKFTSAKKRKEKRVRRDDACRITCCLLRDARVIIMCKSMGDKPLEYLSEADAFVRGTSMERSRLGPFTTNADLGQICID